MKNGILLDKILKEKNYLMRPYYKKKKKHYLLEPNYKAKKERY